MQESLAPEHSGELLGDALEELLDGCGVANKGGRHLETAWWDVTDGGLDDVGDPLDEVRGVLVLDVQHLLVNLLHGHASSEDCGDGQIPEGEVHDKEPNLKMFRYCATLVVDR